MLFDQKENQTGIHPCDRAIYGRTERKAPEGKKAAPEWHIFVHFGSCFTKNFEPFKAIGSRYDCTG